MLVYIIIAYNIQDGDKTIRSVYTNQIKAEKAICKLNDNRGEYHQYTYDLQVMKVTE